MESVPRKPGPNREQVSVNIPEALREQLDELVIALAKPGATMTRSDVIRMALYAGVEELARGHNLSTPKRSDERSPKNDEPGSKHKARP